jgi:3-(3-hydroxy-phenyl)propionate hydroxylase
MLTDLPGAGALFPQTVSASGWLDDHLGQGAWLIGRDLPVVRDAGLRGVALGDPVLAPFAGPVAAWLDSHQADAVLVRPDRHVFGTGPAAILLGRWQEMLSNAAAGNLLRAIP